MNMQPIDVPGYVADDFNKAPTNLFRSREEVERSLARTFRLTAHALEGLSDRQWVVNDGQYHSPVFDEPYGLHRVGDKFYVYAEERGKRGAIAIFKDDHLAAKYFVWLVSDGERTIDWNLFLEMVHSGS